MPPPFLSPQSSPHNDAADCDFDVIFIGGGIVGMALRLVLSEAHVHCQILERACTLPQMGAAIGLHPNGWMAWWTISPAVHEHFLKSSLPSRFSSDAILLEQPSTSSDGHARHPSHLPHA